MNPLMVSTGEALSCTQAMSYFDAVGVLAGAIPLDERTQGVGHRLAGKGNGGLEVLYDLGDLAAS